MMKQFVYLILFLLLLSIIVPQISHSKEVADTGKLIMTAVSDTEADYFLDGLGVETLEEESYEHSIACFAVSHDGAFALGFDAIDTHIVFVYDQTGAFQYGLKFKFPGSFGIFFSGENLSIYSPRSGYTAKYDGVSQFVEVHKVTDTLENNEITHSMMNGTEINNGVGTYTLERNIGIVARSYSRVVFSDGNNEKLLYDVSGAHTAAVFMKVLLVAGFIAVLCFAVKYSVSKNEEQKQ